MSTGKFALTDIDKPKGGKFSAADVSAQLAQAPGVKPSGDLLSDMFNSTQGMAGAVNLPPAGPEDIASAKRGLTSAAVMYGSMGAPLAIGGEGGGLLGFLGRLFGKSILSGAGAGGGKMAAEAVTGENPFSEQNLKQTAVLSGFTATLALPFTLLGELPSTKAGRAVINKSLGATGRDFTYANPSRAITNEDITDVATGDWDAYQRTIRATNDPAQAAQAAGGRFAAVGQRINELTPRLNSLLSKSPAKIPVQTVIDKPLEDAALEVINNPALGDTEKMAAITKLGELQKSLKEGLGSEMTPQQAQFIKQSIGNRVNWGGTSAVTDDVKQVYRDLYGSLKNAIHKSVPGTEVLDNRLTDLLGAMGDLESAAKGGEYAKMPFTLTGKAESGIGHLLPAAASVGPAAIPMGATIGEQLQSKGVPTPATNAPALPFRPGAGVPKPKPQP